LAPVQLEEQWEKSSHDCGCECRVRPVVHGPGPSLAPLGHCVPRMGS
jgi:hypothetical protein